MLAVVAQWTGKEQVHANCVVPILVSSEQGHLKSTFCKGLPPPCLHRYYTEKFSLTSQGDAERKLAEMALINLDEFDRYSLVQMPQLKNLMQLSNHIKKVTVYFPVSPHLSAHPIVWIY